MKQKILENWSSVLARLQICYDRAIKAKDDPSFFINLINYISIFDKSPKLQQFIKNEIVRSAEEDHSLLNKLDAEVVDECVNTFDEISKYVEDNNITEKAILNLSNQFLGYKDGKIIASNGRTANMLFNLNRMMYHLWDMDNGKHKKYLNKFIKSADDDRGVVWKTQDKDDLYEVEQRKVNRLALTKIWFYWDKLAYLYNVYVDYEKIQKDWYDKGSFFGMAGTNEAYTDLLRHLGLEKEEKERIRYFYTDELRRSLVQFHFHLNDSISFNETEKTTISFDDKSRELSVAGTPLIFKEGKRADILTLLFKNKTKVYFDEVLDYVEGVDVQTLATGKEEDKKKMSKYKKNFVNYCEGINTQVAKIGYPSFLRFTSNFVEVNTPYSYK